MTNETDAANSNRAKLKQLLLDIFLISEGDFRWDLKRDEVPTWDSLGTVSMAVGVQGTFGYHLTPDEAIGIHGFEALAAILSDRGIKLDD